MNTGITDLAPLKLISRALHPLDGGINDYDALMEDIGEASYVLIGEASHGTHEFYRERAHLTRRLLAEKGFHAVAVEADWPDAYRANEYVKGQGTSRSAVEALAGFERFPAWMWRNTDVVSFLEWLRTYNDSLAPERPKIGFYGLDLYSLSTSIQTVLKLLDETDPPAGQIARARYACFDPYLGNIQKYAYTASLGIKANCREPVVQQLMDLQQARLKPPENDRSEQRELWFNIEQNARLIRNAERYYRTMFAGAIQSWNLRDAHMTEIFQALLAHLREQNGQPPKVVIWAHNSHIGDARATEMGWQGEWNMGQLLRQRYGAQCYAIGFTTYTGTVTAAESWDGLPLQRQVRPALAKSYEQLFHQLDVPDFWLGFNRDPDLGLTLQGPRLERAIGVIYQPGTERQSHYFQTRLSQQFDALIHLDSTRAVEPLDRNIHWEQGEIPETFPSAY